MTVVGADIEYVRLRAMWDAAKDVCDLCAERPPSKVAKAVIHYVGDAPARTGVLCDAAPIWRRLRGEFPERWHPELDGAVSG